MPSALLTQTLSEFVATPSIFLLDYFNEWKENSTMWLHKSILSVNQFLFLNTLAHSAEWIYCLLKVNSQNSSAIHTCEFLGFQNQLHACFCQHFWPNFWLKSHPKSSFLGRNVSETRCKQMRKRTVKGWEPWKIACCYMWNSVVKVTQWASEQISWRSPRHLLQHWFSVSG